LRINLIDSTHNLHVYNTEMEYIKSYIKKTLAKLFYPDRYLIIIIIDYLHFRDLTLVLSGLVEKYRYLRVPLVFKTMTQNEEAFTFSFGSPQTMQLVEPKFSLSLYIDRNLFKTIYFKGQCSGGHSAHEVYDDEYEVACSLTTRCFTKRKGLGQFYIHIYNFTLDPFS
jgi:hypothetical protein